MSQWPCVRFLLLAFYSSVVLGFLQRPYSQYTHNERHTTALRFDTKLNCAAKDVPSQLAPKVVNLVVEWANDEVIAELAPRSSVTSAINEIRGNDKFWKDNEALFLSWWDRIEAAIRSEDRSVKVIIGEDLTKSILDFVEKLDVFDPATVRAFLQNQAFESMIGSILYEGIFEFIQRVDIIGNVIKDIPLIGNIRQLVITEVKKNLDRTLGGQVKNFLASYSRVAVQRMIEFILSPNNRAALQRANRNVAQSLLDRKISSIVPSKQQTDSLRQKVLDVISTAPATESIGVFDIMYNQLLKENKVSDVVSIQEVLDAMPTARVALVALAERFLTSQQGRQAIVDVISTEEGTSLLMQMLNSEKQGRVLVDEIRETEALSRILVTDVLGLKEDKAVVAEIQKTTQEGYKLIGEVIESEKQGRKIIEEVLQKTGGRIRLEPGEGPATPSKSSDSDAAAPKSPSPSMSVRASPAPSSTSAPSSAPAVVSPSTVKPTSTAAAAATTSAAGTPVGTVATSAPSATTSAPPAMTSSGASTTSSSSAPSSGTASSTAAGATSGTIAGTIAGTVTASSSISSYAQQQINQYKAAGTATTPSPATKPPTAPASNPNPSTMKIPIETPTRASSAAANVAVAVKPSVAAAASVLPITNPGKPTSAPVKPTTVAPAVQQATAGANSQPSGSAGSGAPRPPLPPFTRDTAIQKVRMAEDAWNTRDPVKVSLAYTEDSVWRNRAEFVKGREEIVKFLERKWNREIEYRLIKELWAVEGNRIAVRFAYEWRDDSNQWYRSYGNENWEFTSQGYMRRRIASINDMRIQESERLFFWPPGRRPDDYPGLTDLGL